MKYNKTLALVPAILLAACGGEEQTMKAEVPAGSVIYSYPADGQTGISPTSDIVVRFSHAISEEEADIRNKIVVTDGTNNIDYEVKKVDGGRSLKLEPVADLTTGTEYSVTFAEPLATANSTPIGTPNAEGPEGIQFDTRGGFTGIAGLDNLASEFDVARMIPSPEGEFRPMDFSSFRLVLTQPIHPQWKVMGGTIRLEDSSGNPVPASVIVDQRRITIDPCLTEDPARCGTKADELASGASYTVKISGLPSLTNPDARLDFEKSFTARETGPTVVLFQEVIGSGLLEGQKPQVSILNGQIINGVTLNSVLQGTAGPSQQTGGLFAELAYAPAFEADEPLPLRVPRSSVLNSSSLDVKINGRVPIINPETGDIQQTGNIKVTMLSDASGYLLPNPYTDDLNAPRHVKLFMDVAMNTEEAQPNASLSQNLLGVELSGIALVEDGVLQIDAIGVVEPNLLGQEFTDSTIAFRIEAATDADSALDAEDLWEPDTTSPTLVSWMPGPDSAIPGDRDQMQRPGDPIVLNFNEPIDPETLGAGLTLDEGGIPLTLGDGTLEAFVDGTAVVINPVDGLEHGVDYSLDISGGLTDIAGNPATSQSLKFALPAIENENGTTAFTSPFALTTYPGFPCVTEGVDLVNGSHGICVDDAPAGYSSELERDQLPVTTLPKDRPIVVKFSQSMDLTTISSSTFIVEKIADPSAPGDVGTEVAVPGRLELGNQRLRFFPDSNWEVGATYRYTMTSAPGGDCATGDLICSSKGLPLDTDLLMGQGAGPGGPNLSIYFTGTESVQSVFTPLRNLPVRDTNSNYVVDCGTPGGKECLEPFDHETDGNGGFKPSANAAKLTVVNQTATVLGVEGAGAQVGCDAGEDCEENKFIYQTYGLDTEVVGPVLDSEGQPAGVRVLLYPTLLMTTNASVFLDGLGEQRTGPQILRMTYGEPTEDNPLGLVEGVITEGPDGRPTFMATADLTLDAPDLTVPLEGALRHNLYSYPFSLELKGPITFFDDGRMQIEQRNTNVPELDVLVTTDNAILGGTIDFASCLGGLLTGDTTACEELLSGTTESSGAVKIPLQIPEQGVYLNFISNPIKEIPAKQ
ncbi:Ig-like domain-containing protein [Marinobacter pelagius]|uniref:Ig-like domain-containing protein n=1 Tax=Marinobacter pelagius TaxID=379482 RepID=A0A366GJG0_9GAMM|nr:Ig-like domain-containing protein [Marinobacter pelagius]RBP26463.1 Ig-like domain-containing protein [Marinobacter pelagius]